MLAKAVASSQTVSICCFQPLYPPFCFHFPALYLCILIINCAVGSVVSAVRAPQTPRAWLLTSNADANVHHCEFALHKSGESLEAQITQMCQSGVRAVQSSISIQTCTDVNDFAIHKWGVGCTAAC